MSESNLIVPSRLIARRSLLATAGQATLSAAAVAILAGCESMATSKTADAASAEGDIKILNTALGAEHEAIAAYQVGAESGLLKPDILKVAVNFQSQHKEHADVLAGTIKKLGGTAGAPKAKYDFPVDKLKNQEDVLRFAAGLEKGAVSAYLGAVPLFTNRDLAKAAASILGDEAMHWAVLRSVLGEDPVPAAFVA
jgi:rubrerythrin